MNRRLVGAAAFATALWAPAPAPAYPLEGYESAGIGRLEEARRVQAGELPGAKQPPGALLPLAAVDLRLAGRADFVLPPPDPGFARDIAGLLGGYADRYNIAILDLSDPAAPRYAEHNATEMRNPGSVGKLLVALAIFQALADRFPDDIGARERVLRETVVIADDFVIRDSHTVRRWDREHEQLIRRPLQPGDRGTLYEWLDWMLSASSNAAAAQLMQHAMLMRRYGPDYPPPPEEVKRFLRETPKAELGRLLEETMQSPVTRNGLDLRSFRQGSFFTATGKRYVPGTSSHGNVRELMKYLILMEQGRLVDQFSSREIKRLLYSTERRIRYASSPALAQSAVYFKSGSLFECRPEPDFVCRPYQGNVKNYMNSVAIVEHPAAERRLYYLVALMSNVLRRNSAVDHQSLATRIQRLIEKRHPAVAPASTARPAASPGAAREPDVAR